MSDKKDTINESKSTSTKVLHVLSKKIIYLQEIRHEIKKRRILFDETKERFGLDEMSQLVKVKNTSEVKGYPFKACKASYKKTRGIRFGLKIVPIETKYDKTEHPCNLENLILKDLTENIVNKNISPHVAYYLGTQKVNNKSKALKMLNLKRLEVEEKIRTHSNMLISEFVEGGSLDNWVYNIYEDDKEISDEQWKNIVFQLLYTIAIMQHYYRMMHNDFHYGNILIDDSLTPGGYFVYDIGGKTYYIKNTGIIPKLWDFEFSMVYSNKIPESYPNKFIIGPYEYDRKAHKTIIDKSKLADDETEDPSDLNVPYNYNEVYDVHYFLTSLLDLYISQELFDWIIQLYPREVIPEDDDSSSSDSSTSSSSDSSTSSSSDSSTSSSSDTSSDSSDDKHHKNSVNEKDDKNSDNDNEIDELIKDLTLSDKNSDKNSLSSSSDSSSEIDSEPLYISEGRLINGTEDVFKLPTPLDLLKDKLFESFTVKPNDFDETTAIYFKSGF
jgi:hypothetical protein